jgi:hypothetical protein
MYLEKGKMTSNLKWREYIHKCNNAYKMDAEHICCRKKISCNISNIMSYEGIIKITWDDVQIHSSHFSYICALHLYTCSSLLEHVDGRRSKEVKCSAFRTLYSRNPITFSSSRGLDRFEMKGDVYPCVKMWLESHVWSVLS